MHDNQENRISIINTLVFITYNTFITLCAYIFIASFINLLPVITSIFYFLKIIKIFLSMLIIHSIKKIFIDSKTNVITQNIYLLLLNFMNVGIIFYLKQLNIYNTWSISQEIIYLILLTAILFICDSYGKNTRYYIDNKLISIAYFLLNITSYQFLFIALEILLSFKLMSVYKSINYIITHNIKYSKFYLFLIFFSIISRFFDIKST